MSESTLQKAITITGVSNEYEVIKYADIAIPQIGQDEILIKNKYVGVSYAEILFRKGIWPVAQFPYVLGFDGLGVISEVGANVKNFSVGDKVAYITTSAFAQYIKLRSDHPQVAKIDGDSTDEQIKVFGSGVVGTITALVLVEEAHKVEAGQTVLVWAAAGGVGQVLTQLIVAKGATVIAVASTKEKLDVAKSLGATFVINSATEDVVEKVKEFTHGNGVNASYDSIGKETFDTSLKSLARKGTLVSFGSASGSPDPVDLNILSRKSLTVAKVDLLAYITTPEEWNHYFEQFKKIVKDGTIKLEVSKTYPLSEYAEAARSIEERKTTGRLVLAVPQ